MRTIDYMILAAGLLVAGVALAKERPTPVNPKGEAQLAKLLEGRVAGKPMECVNLQDLQDSQIIDGTAIVYRRGRTLLVNRPEFGADELDDNQIIVTKTFNSQLCRIDSVNLVDRTSHFQRGFLGLGKFVPYTKPR